MKTIALIMGLLLGTYANGAEKTYPDPAVPEAGSNLSEWEDYTKMKWSNEPGISSVGVRGKTRDGIFIDVEVTHNRKCKTVWEVTRDWRRGVSKLGFLLRATDAGGAGVLLVNDQGIDAAEILRCETACKQFKLQFIVVDSQGRFK